MFRQRCRCPLPEPAHVSLPAELVAVLGDGHGMPVLEADIGRFEVDEEIVW